LLTIMDLALATVRRNPGADNREWDDCWRRKIAVQISIFAQTSIGFLIVSINVLIITSTFLHYQWNATRIETDSWGVVCAPTLQISSSRMQI
jgi:hypothetical protein